MPAIIGTGGLKIISLPDIIKTQAGHLIVTHAGEFIAWR